MWRDLLVSNLPLPVRFCARNSIPLLTYFLVFKMGVEIAGEDGNYGSAGHVANLP